MTLLQDRVLTSIDVNTVTLHQCQGFAKSTRMLYGAQKSRLWRHCSDVRILDIKILSCLSVHGQCMFGLVNRHRVWYPNHATWYYYVGAILVAMVDIDAMSTHLCMKNSALCLTLMQCQPKYIHKHAYYYYNNHIMHIKWNIVINIIYIYIKINILCRHVLMICVTLLCVAFLVDRFILLVIRYCCSDDCSNLLVCVALTLGSICFGVVY